jgi:hypothetical protein
MWVLGSSLWLKMEYRVSATTGHCAITFVTVWYNTALDILIVPLHTQNYIYIYIYIYTHTHYSINYRARGHHWSERQKSVPQHTYGGAGTRWGEWSASRPGRALPPGKGSRYQQYSGLGGPPEPVWTQRLEEESFRLCQRPNLRPVVQSVARHYTDWATPAHIFPPTLEYVEYLVWIPADTFLE